MTAEPKTKTKTKAVLLMKQKRAYLFFLGGEVRSEEKILAALCEMRYDYGTGEGVFRSKQSCQLCYAKYRQKQKDFEIIEESK